MKDKKTILVIEDETPLQRAIKSKMELNGFAAVTARSVEQAIEYLEDKEINVDVIWLDHYLLGKENGLDLVARVKNHQEWKNIPIFVVSNTATESKVKTYLQLGVDKFYTKSDNKLEEIIEDINITLN